MKLHFDFETRSVVDLITAGQYAYAEHPSTQAILASWAIDDEPFKCWYILSGEPIPFELRLALLDPKVVLVAHNASFERVISVVVGLRQGFFTPDIVSAIKNPERWSCTAARAAAVGLPRGLEKVAMALYLSHQKDMEGHRLMLEMCKPHMIALDGTITWLEDIARIKRLGQYCISDGYAERDVDTQLPDLSPFEHETWCTTEKMNDRGIEVDSLLVQRLMFLTKDATNYLNGKLHALSQLSITGAWCGIGSNNRECYQRDGNAALNEHGMCTHCGGRPLALHDTNLIPKVTNPKSIVRWLADYGIDTEDSKIGKWIIAGLLEDEDIPPIVREVLILRRDGGKSSTSKFNTLMKRMNLDVRIRGALMYAGAAATKRWSSKGVQLQNLPRGGKIKKIAEAILAVIGQMSIQDIEKTFGPPMVVASELLRPVFIAGEGYWLARADYSQVEARVNAWLAGEIKVLRAFAAYDRGEGPDIYIVTASGIYGVTAGEITKDDPRRQVGKVTILACIAEGQLVLTDQGLVPIESVTLDMMLWDGESWVSHSGAVYRGEKDCITYDGLTATEDHEVFVENFAGTCTFGSAAERGLRIRRARVGREASGHDRDIEQYDNSRTSKECEERSRTSCLGEMHSVQFSSHVEDLGTDTRRPEQRLSVMCGKRDADLSLASQETTSSKAEMHRSNGISKTVEPLRWERDNLRLSISPRSDRMVHTELTEYTGETDKVSRIGQDKQQQRLCPGELTSHVSIREHDESRRDMPGRRSGNEDTIHSCSARVQTSESAYQVRGQHFAKSASPVGGGRSKSALGKNQGISKTRRRVWDILDAGPNNSFVVSSRIVHNCGFQGGLNAFKSMARIYNVKISDEKAEEAKTNYRLDNPNIVSFWYDLNTAAVSCMQGQPGEIHHVRTGIYFKRNDTVLTMHLPSGSNLVYWYPRLEMKPMPWDANDLRPAVTYYAEDSQKKVWRRFTAYGGLFCENAVQAVARDIMAFALNNLERLGARPVLTVHDEAVCQLSKTKFPTREAAKAAMLQVVTIHPDWLPDWFPLVADASADDRYVKA